MRVRVGINGMGRIGRDVLRGAVERNDPAFRVVAVNDVAPPETITHLLRHDSTYGRWGRTVEFAGGFLTVDDHSVRMLQEPDPARLDWAAHGVDVVVEATGRFRTRERAAAHLTAGARKVVLTSPGTGVDATIVMGINDDVYEATHHDVVSNASCTTNCVTPMAQVLHRAFGLEEGLITTIHSYTSDQNLLDGPHKDLRRARSAAVNIIPTSTGAARAVGEVLPELAGRLDGIAVRVPVVDGSLVDLTVRLSEPATIGQVNRAFETAADGPLKGILRYTTDPVVSHDVIGESASCLFDSTLTRVVGSTVKVFGWYDNEWGYAQRTIDLVDLVACTLPER
ncbi:type I glyceraldehyde-3-phosphate dehydrogenase [Pseudonocardia abyssalis]|uniref:Type I glyceraldehyde-3-phosphate dehydrogenase n=1 Tax=Pseudonocardia abyssalis TaxID=2792008 RepID=A0ABS6US87_9PSEU|nr:type I glyceraldehyde-3-phosphate dehydrogenase [Pseudonocardia abyssalis]MBW0113875.1 type I glyceraldehyde-3-phosphate dehydrogenase [Pseudonocardia abyssalis]MBW0135128.1 type I glyceraldehyde-3-phosphate dehydrogenase [Pseudonocardia abyssalis]